MVDWFFNVFQGLQTEMDKDPVMFGSYSFSAEENSPSLQFFPVQNDKIDQPYQIIELRIESNHGNPKYTCLYRFRVHGNTMKRWIYSNNETTTQPHHM